MRVSTTERILVTVPLAVHGGGVSAFWETVVPNLTQSVRVVRVGKRADSDWLLARVLRSLRITLLICWRARPSRTSLVVLNPSLDGKSLLRDGLTLVVLRLLRRPTFVFFHGWDLEAQARIEHRFRRPFTAVFGRADCLAVLSSSFRVSLRHWGCRCPITVVTTVAPFPDSPSPPAASRVGNSQKSMKILFMARLVTAKGLEQSIRAVALLRETRPDVQMVVAGEGPARSGAEELSRRLGLVGVDFVGNVSGDEKSRLLSGSEVFLLPSEHGEGMPVSVLEAMSYGLVVLATPVGGLADFLVDGRNCLLLHSGSPEEIAAKLDLLYRDASLRGSLGESARRQAARAFLPDVVARRMSRLLSDTVHAVQPHEYSWLDDAHINREYE